jgi:ATP/maltotriose-dependent transcriptional regulator MalT
LEFLLSRWEQVKEGRGQVVLLSLEAVIGKSRLVHMLQAQVARAPAAWLTPCQCLAHYQNSTLQMTRDTLQMAQEVSHPLTLAYAMTFSAIFHQFRRETAPAKALAESALRLATEQGFGSWMAFLKIVLGELVEPGDIGAGIARTREGIAAFRATGAELFLPFHLTQLAEAYGKVGQADAGLAVLDEALSLVERGGEHMWDADLYRVKGELMLMQGADTSAQGHSVFEFNTDESQCLHRLGSQPAARRRNVGMTRPSQQPNGGIA